MTGQPRPEGLVYPQSAVLVHRGHGETLEVLLISNLRGTRWVIPKGLVEPELSPEDSAAKEAWEEAGVIGAVFPEVVGRYSYRKWGGTCMVEVFRMELEELTEDYPEVGMRSLRWVSPEKAAASVREPELADILVRLPVLLP